MALALSAHEATDVASMAVAVAFTLVVGFYIARFYGCSQCRAVNEQEITLVKRLLGDRELHPVQQHRLSPRRHRPHTAAELLELLDVNGALLTPARWREIESLHNQLGYRKLPKQRDIAGNSSSAHIRPQSPGGGAGSKDISPGGAALDAAARRDRIPAGKTLPADSQPNPAPSGGAR